MIALAENDYDKAVAELSQSNQQNPYNLFRLAIAYKGNGDAANCKAYCQKAAKFNTLNSLNQGFIRSKAEAMLAKM